MMIKLKWGYGVIGCCVLGLSGCYMDVQNPRHVDATQTRVIHSNVTHEKTRAVQKSYASKDPAQAATPGPKRAAAPQLPVIQQ